MPLQLNTSSPLIAILLSVVFTWGPTAGHAETTYQPMLQKLQADVAQRAGMTGRSVVVGVISDGADGYQALQTSGDLPANIGFVNTWPAGDAEGEAMMQLIHQIAPNATLAFCSGRNANYSVGSCTQALVNNFGANIIVDDLGVTDMYGPSSDSYIDEALLSVNPNVIIVHVAGNNEGLDLFAPFKPISLAIAGTSYQVDDFGAAVGQASNPYETTTIQPGQLLVATLGWTDNPSSPPPASNNLMGIWILDQNGNVLNSIQSNIPWACVLGWINNGSTAMTVNVVAGMIQQNNANPFYMEFQVYPSQPINSVQIEAGGSMGASTLIWSIGAANSVSVNMEPFSAVGPYLSFWSATAAGPETANGIQPLNYTALASPQTFEHPDFVGLDSDEIAGDPSFQNGTTGQISNFLGTSAAAPTVAAVAALLMSAGYTKTQIREAFEQTSIPVPAANQTSTTQSTGTWAPNDGYGLVQAWAAAQYLGYVVPQPQIISPSGNNIGTYPGGSVVFSGNCTEPNSTISAYSWNFGDGTTSTQQNPGAHTFSQNNIYTVTFTCTDANGHTNPHPATVTIDAEGAPPPPPPPPPPPASSSSGGGGTFGLLSLLLLAPLVRLRKRKL